MDKTWHGLDFLRGLGIFGLLIMHSAFYYFSGLFSLDLENPPLIITVIGFLLMFAGLFAIVSGAVHSISMYRLAQKQWQPGRILRKKLVSGLFILIVAYLYFTLTGPGLAEFANSRMNNSILVELIRNGRLVGLNLDRLLYIDSLVMIGSNILLISLIWFGLMRIRQVRAPVLLGLAGAVMLLSLLRLPLYSYYLEQFDQKNWGPVIALFWLVNKNNPVLPFLAFGLLGSWLGLRLETGLPRKLPLILGGLLTVLGMMLYVFLPDTMLQRAIDLKWYSIMIAQLGLFTLMTIGAISLFDLAKKRQPAKGWLFRFISRFGYAGLTAFFLESIVSALIWRLLTAIWPLLQLDIGGALLYGLAQALIWGLVLVFWERYNYVGSIEYLYGRFVTRYGFTSSKAGKLHDRS